LREEQKFRREELIRERGELEKEKELIKNIIKTKEELKKANRNFEFADSNLIDYYIYQIKANQAKLDYLIKIAKTKGINVDLIQDIQFRTWGEEEVV
jgi:DNA-binding MltR family transcriptional regulator